MKKIVLLLMTLSVFTMATTDFTQSEFWKQDKQKHFAYSAGIAATATAISKSYGSNKFEAFWIGLGSSIMVGIAKEVIDGHGYGSEDIGDVYADFLGASTGALISTQFEWKF